MSDDFNLYLFLLSHSITVLATISKSQNMNTLTDVIIVIIYVSKVRKIMKKKERNK